MTIVDTSALVDNLTGPKRAAERLPGLIERGERLAIPRIMLCGWLRTRMTSVISLVFVSQNPFELLARRRDSASSQMLEYASF